MRSSIIRTSFCLFMLTFLCPVYSRENSTELYQKAVVLAKKGDIEGAIKGFKKVLEVNWYYTLGHYGLGKAYLFKENKIKEAIKHLRLAVNFDKSFAKGYFYLGIAYMMNKKYTVSIEAFKNAYRYDSSMFEALFNIAVVYDLIGVPPKSKRYYKMYRVRKSKKDTDVLF